MSSCRPHPATSLVRAGLLLAATASACSAAAEASGPTDADLLLHQDAGGLVDDDPATIQTTEKLVLNEAWWTGPILASGAETLPRGHVLVEPYVFNVRSTGSDYIGSLTYFLVGATNRLTLGAIPTFGAAKSRTSTRHRRLGVGDLTLTAQYRFNRAVPGALLPTVAVVVQRTVPLGRFDRLDDNPDRGIGTGARTTLVGVYAQRTDTLWNGRPLRTRLNLTRSFSPSVRVEGASVYGTDLGFRGAVRPGSATIADVSVEYSVTRNWVLATDLVYRWTGVTSIRPDTGSESTLLPRTAVFSIAPAVEYSWSSTRGVLLGVRLTPARRHSPASVTPVFALNAVF